MFGCSNPNLIESSFKSSGGMAGLQFTKLSIKPDHIKKLYEEVISFSLFISKREVIKSPFSLVGDG